MSIIILIRAPIWTISLCQGEGGGGVWGWGYGEVKDCTRQHWPNLQTVHTVTRLVKMEVRQPIPRNLNIGGIGVKIWHTGQPARCDVYANGHVLAGCLLKGLCSSCKQEGHIARNYPFGAWRRLQDNREFKIRRLRTTAGRALSFHCL